MFSFHSEGFCGQGRFVEFAPMPSGRAMACRCYCGRPHGLEVRYNSRITCLTALIVLVVRVLSSCTLVRRKIARKEGMRVSKVRSDARAEPCLVQSVCRRMPIHETLGSMRQEFYRASSPSATSSSHSITVTSAAVDRFPRERARLEAFAAFYCLYICVVILFGGGCRERVHAFAIFSSGADDSTAGTRGHRLVCAVDDPFGITTV